MPHSSARLARGFVLAASVLPYLLCAPALARVAGVDLSECLTAPASWESDICLIDPGRTGVGKILFDGPVRRRTSDSASGGALVQQPRAAAVIENGVARADGVEDIVYLAANGLWVTTNDAPVATGLNIEGSPSQTGSSPGNSSRVLTLSALTGMSTPLSSSDSVWLVPGNFSAAGAGEGLLIAIGGRTAGNALAIVTPGSWSTLSLTGELGDLSLADLQDVEVTDLDGDTVDDVLLLLGDEIWVRLGGGTQTRFTVVEVKDARRLGARDIDGDGSKEIAVAAQPIAGEVCDELCHPVARVPIAFFTGDVINSFAYLSGSRWVYEVASFGAVEVTDLVDAGDWGLALALDDPPIEPSPMTGPEDYFGHLVLMDTDASGVTGHTASKFRGGARRLLVADLGPSEPATALGNDDSAIVDNIDPAAVDGRDDLFLVGPGARRTETFYVGGTQEASLIDARVGVVTLFQRGAHPNAGGDLRPTSQWRLASIWDDDIHRLPTAPGAFDHRRLDSLAVGQLDTSATLELLTVDPANDELVVLRAQPPPCAVFVNTVVHGHMGTSSQLNWPPAPAFSADKGVERALSAMTEWVVRINEARRPGQPAGSTTPDLCPFRAIEVHGHWEEATFGRGAGIALTLRRGVETFSQYGIGLHYMADALLGVQVAVDADGRLYLLTPDRLRDLSAFDPDWYWPSYYLALPMPSPSMALLTGKPMWYSLARRKLADLSTSLASYARSGFSNSQNLVAAELSRALGDALRHARRRAGGCMPVLFDISAFSRGTTTTSEALSRVVPGQAGPIPFAADPLTRYDVGIAVNYIDGIDGDPPPWPGLDTPWSYSGQEVADGLLRRRGNELITTIHAGFPDPQLLLEPLRWGYLQAKLPYVALLGDLSDPKFDAYGFYTHSLALPVGHDRFVSLAMGEHAGCGPSGCDGHAGRERGFSVMNRGHVQLYYQSPEESALDADDPDMQFLHPVGLYRDDQADPVAKGQMTSCDADPVLTREPDYCYASNSFLGPYMKSPRDLEPLSTDIYGWAPTRDDGFLRNDSHEAPFRPAVCPDGTVNVPLNVPAADVRVPAGRATISPELVPDWDFRRTTAVVEAVRNLQDTSIDGKSLVDSFDLDDGFSDIGGFSAFADYVDGTGWIDGAWRQRDCVYDATDPCSPVTAQANANFNAVSFGARFSAAILEGVDMDAVGAAFDDKRADVLFEGIQDRISGLDPQARRDRQRLLGDLVSGVSGPGEAYARFPDEPARLEADLDVQSLLYQELLVRVDAELTHPAAYLTITLAGHHLDAERRIHAPDPDEAARTYATYVIDRGSQAQGLQPDMLALQGRNVRVYSVSVRPHRILGAPGGQLYELVQIPEGVTWDHADAIAARTQYFGHGAKLARPTDEVRALEIIETLQADVPAWVGASREQTATEFVLDDGTPVPSAVFKGGFDADARWPLYAFYEPGDSVIAGRDNGVLSRGAPMAFILEYDPIPGGGSGCLDKVPLRAHWPIDSGDVAAPMSESSGRYNLPSRTGASAGPRTGLIPDGGKSLHATGNGIYFSGRADRAMTNDILNGATVSLWFRPERVSGTPKLFYVGGAPYKDIGENAALWLRQFGEELQVGWERGAGGTDHSLTTDGLKLSPHRTYHLVVSLHESTTSSSLQDVRLYVSEAGAGRIHEATWFDQPRANLLGNANKIYLSGDDHERFLGGLDSVRLFSEPISSLEAWELFESESVGEGSCGTW